MKKIIYPKNFSNNRDSIIIDYSKNKNVLHIWACDSPFTKEKINWKIWPLLYKEINNVCLKQIWIDLDKESIEIINDKKNWFNKSETIFFDMNKLWELNFTPDIIVLWEVIEHLMNLEIALSNIKKIMNKDTLLIISTPNSLDINFIINSIFWFEILHHDHKVSFSYWTLSNLLEYNWFCIEKAYFTKLIWFWKLNIFWKIRKVIDKIFLNRLKYNNWTLLFVVKLK